MANTLTVSRRCHRGAARFKTVLDRLGNRPRVRPALAFSEHEQMTRLTYKAGLGQGHIHGWACRGKATPNMSAHDL